MKMEKDKRPEDWIVSRMDRAAADMSMAVETLKRIKLTEEQRQRLDNNGFSGLSTSIGVVAETLEIAIFDLKEAAAVFRAQVILCGSLAVDVGMDRAIRSIVEGANDLER